MDPITPQPQEQQESQYQAPISETPQRYFLNKKFIVTFVILFLLGSGAYAGIWYWQNQQVAQETVPTFTPRPSASPDPTANWKTYTNTQYGFELKIPYNFTESESKPAGIPQFSFGSSPQTALRISIFNNQNTVAESYGPDWQSVGAVTIDSYQARKLQRTTGQYTETAYLIDSKNLAIDFEDSKFSSVSQQTLDQILSTFKFTDSIDTSIWKTYTNTEYGIELKYPPTWKIQEKVTGFGFWINPPDFKMPSSGTVNPYFSFDITAHMYLGEEKPVIKTFGTSTGYVYDKDKSVYFSATTGAGGYFIKLYTPAGVDEPNQILSTFKFTK